MTKTLNMPMGHGAPVRFSEGQASSIPREPWPGTAPRSVPYVPPRVLDLESAAVRPRPAKGNMHSAFVNGRDASFGLDGEPKHAPARHAPLIVSICALVAWLILMLTVVAKGGDLIQIAAITMIPLLAHVVSLHLAARRALPERNTTLEH